MKNRNGVVLVLGLFCFSLMSLVLFLLVDVGHLQFWRLKTRYILDAIVLSALRVRDEGLMKIADRWNEFGEGLEFTTDGVVVMPPNHWERATNQSNKLIRAIPGYKGRISSVQTIVAEANGLARHQTNIIDKSDFDLGVSPQTIPVLLESGEVLLWKGGWIKRHWTKQDQLNLARLSLRVEVPTQASTWVFEETSQGQLVWDADQTHPYITSWGNGGFPWDTQDLSLRGLLIPHRQPIYRAELK